MTHFHWAVDQTLQAEGLFSDTLGDPGGRTKYGITEATWKATQREVPTLPRYSIENISKDDAIFIYKRNYWDPLGLDHISDKYVAAELFDTAVNCGLGTATQIAQRACNVLSLHNEQIVADGRMGPVTRQRLNALSQNYAMQLVVAMNACQFDYYERLADQPRFKKFIKGWMRRCKPMLAPAPCAPATQHTTTSTGDRA